MSIKELRVSAGMTQRSFAEKYQIPLQTIKQWESDPNSTSYRTPPDYVIHMLERLVDIDFAVSDNSNERVKYLIEAARQSRYNAAHWMRYLRKYYEDNEFKLTKQELRSLLDNDELTMFQKVCLSRASNPDTPTGSYIASLNQRANTPMLEEIMRRQGNVG